MGEVARRRDVVTPRAFVGSGACVVVGTLLGASMDHAACALAAEDRSLGMAAAAMISMTILVLAEEHVGWDGDFTSPESYEGLAMVALFLLASR